jgi:hypothetical protein
MPKYKRSHVSGGSFFFTLITDRQGKTPTMASAGGQGVTGRIDVVFLAELRV